MSYLLLGMNIERLQNATLVALALLLKKPKKRKKKEREYGGEDEAVVRHLRAEGFVQWFVSRGQGHRGCSAFG